MPHVINFNNVDRVYLSDNMAVVHFNGSEKIPFFDEEARRIRNVLEKLTSRASGWYNIKEED